MRGLVVVIVALHVAGSVGAQGTEQVRDWVLGAAAK